MKIKLNERYPRIDELRKALVMEFPELTLRIKPRTKWGLDKPAFKHKKKLYAFESEDALIDRIRRLLDDEPDEAVIVLNVTPTEGEGVPTLELFNEKEELLLEVPLEKYDLDNLNIKFRLGAHEERSSSYEVEHQTLVYEKESEEEKETAAGEEEIAFTEGEEEILLTIPVAKYNLSDLNVKIKFSHYGEASSTYEVESKKESKDEEPQPPSAEPNDPDPES